MKHITKLFIYNLIYLNNQLIRGQLIFDIGESELNLKI